MATKKSKTDEAPKEGMEIKTVPMDPQTMYLRLVGTSPLVVHAFSEKAKREMRDKQQGAAKKKKEPKVVEVEFNGARYRYPSPENPDQLIDGFPAYTIKKSLINACRMMDNITMVAVKQIVHVNRGDIPFRTEDGGAITLVPIESEPGKPYFGEHGTEAAPICREDVVRVGGRGPGTGTADLRYRPEYYPWSIPVRVEYLPNLITPEQLVNLFRNAGFGCGIGENRPEKTGGDWGCFSVEVDEIAQAKHERERRMADAAE